MANLNKYVTSYLAPVYLNLKLWENFMLSNAHSAFRTLLTVTRNLFWSVTNVLK